jgi:hypothetical protein
MFVLWFVQWKLPSVLWVGVSMNHLGFCVLVHCYLYCCYFLLLWVSLFFVRLRILLVAPLCCFLLYVPLGMRRISWTQFMSVISANNSLLYVQWDYIRSKRLVALSMKLVPFSLLPLC